MAVQDTFGQLLGLLEALARQPAGKQGLRACPHSLKQLRGVGQLLARRMDIERKYIHRLEGESCDILLVRLRVLRVTRGLPACKRLREPTQGSLWVQMACSYISLGLSGWALLYTDAL